MAKWVAVGVEVCPICYVGHDETVLFDKRMEKSFDSPKVRTGWSLCPKHKAMEAEYIALVEVSNSNPKSPNDAVPTGVYAHIRREVAKQIFNVPLEQIPFAYVELGMLAVLSSKIESSNTQGDPDGCD